MKTTALADSGSLGNSRGQANPHGFTALAHQPSGSQHLASLSRLITLRSDFPPNDNIICIPSRRPGIKQYWIPQKVPFRGKSNAVAHDLPSITRMFSMILLKTSMVWLSLGIRQRTSALLLAQFLYRWARTGTVPFRKNGAILDYGKQIFIREMYAKYPYLWLCEDDWKVRQLGSTAVSQCRRAVTRKTGKIHQRTFIKSESVQVKMEPAGDLPVAAWTTMAAVRQLAMPTTTMTRTTSTCLTP